jgi:hypothetical protein
MSSAHKAALARGRAEGHVVRRYLEAIEVHRPRRGRRRTRESVERRLAVVNARLTDAEPLQRLHLLQERADLSKELGRMASQSEVPALEKAFVEVARAYGRRKGIGYEAWRAAGVSAAVLQRAGVTRIARSTSPVPAVAARSRKTTASASSRAANKNARGTKKSTKAATTRKSKSAAASRTGRSRG